MKSTAQFYHAGCQVCLGAERMVLTALDRSRYDIEVIHLGTDKGRIAEAEQLGIKSVPALVLEGTVYHINFGASLADLK